MSTPHILSGNHIGGEIPIIGQEPKTKIDYSLKTKIHNEKIEIELQKATETIAKWVADTRDKATRRALIALGWTPPGGILDSDLEETKIVPNVVTPPAMLPSLDSYDWAEVFGEGTGGNCTPIRPQPQPPSYTGSQETFSRLDVAEIYGQEDGENDGPEWIIYGRLKDGRYFCARGGCDYTGWDCRASNSGDVAATRNDIVRFGLTQDERNRFKIVLECSNE